MEIMKIMVERRSLKVVNLLIYTGNRGFEEISLKDIIELKSFGVY